MSSKQTIDFGKRRERLWKRVRKTGAKAMLVTRQINVRYLTGFSGSSGFLWLDQEKSILLSDSRYESQISDECPDIDVLIRDAGSTQMDLIVEMGETLPGNGLAFESDHVSYEFAEQLKGRIAGDLVPVSGLVQELRMIKDRAEIELIRNSIRVNERAYEVVRSQLTAEQTEREIAHNLEHQIRKFGGAGCSFDPIVAVGPRSALPHARPTDQTVGTSGFLLLDWGSQVGGYASDLTRMIVTAKIPPKIRRIYDVVLKAQAAAIAKIRPGVTFQSADNEARKVIGKAGFGKYFGHGLGHGFGLEIHETPFVSPIRKGEFSQNMVLTVEPGIYLPGIGGVRIEDNIRVTKDGVELLSSLPTAYEQTIVRI